MSLHILQNFFKQTITQPWATGTGNFYVSVKPVPTSGWLVISPSSTTLREIVYYSAVGTDATGDYITISTGGRGLGGTTEQTHEIGEAVRMNYTAEHQDEISDALDQIVAAGAQDASTATKGIVKMSVTPAVATNPIAVGDNDPRVPTADPTTIFAVKKFGGNGADGALAITSGATNIDLGGLAVVVKNYTSISITGTGSLTFTNPHANGTYIILKSQGNVTLTSSAAPMIDCRNTGGAGGTSVASNIGAGANSSAGNDGHIALISTLQSNGGKGGMTTNPAVGGAVPTVFSLSALSNLFTYINNKFNFLVFAGAGGGSGSEGTGSGGSFNGTSAVGGKGGGALLIECGGAWNFTTTGGISVSGSVGAVGTAAGGGNYTAGGGGGGGGGFFLALYNILTANTGTALCAGGVGGTATVGGGGGGQYFGGGGGANPLNVGSNATNNGGNGAAGFSLITQNTEIA